jgi:hypothetical protein
MMMGRWRRAYFGVGAFLMMLATVGAPAALGTTRSLEWDPPSYDFGPVPYASGPSEPHEFTLTNIGETQLVTKYWRSAWVAYWPKASDPFGASSPSDCHILEPGESCSVELVFGPAHPGIWKGWQKVRSREDEPWTELELTGEGTGPWVPVTPEQLVFESTTVGMATTPQTITLESQDRKELEIEDISITSVGGWPPSPTPFRVVGGSCHVGASLAPGETCTIEVVMAPTVSGLFQYKLRIIDTAPGSPQSVDLEGTATAAPADGPPLTPTATTPPARLKRACPKGKRKVVKKGRRICVKKHPAHSAR